jgi:hypothetical protein
LTSIKNWDDYGSDVDAILTLVCFRSKATSLKRQDCRGSEQPWAAASL